MIFLRVVSTATINTHKQKNGFDSMKMLKQEGVYQELLPPECKEGGVFFIQLHSNLSVNKSVKIDLLKKYQDSFWESYFFFKCYKLHNVNTY